MHRFALLLLLATTVFAEASGPGAVPVVAPVEGVAPAGAAAQQPSMLPRPASPVAVRTKPSRSFNR